MVGDLDPVRWVQDWVGDEGLGLVEWAWMAGLVKNLGKESGPPRDEYQPKLKQKLIASHSLVVEMLAVILQCGPRENGLRSVLYLFPEIKETVLDIKEAG